MNAIRNVEVRDTGVISCEFWTIDMPGRDDYCGGEIDFPNREQYELARANAERKGWDVPAPIDAATFGDLTNAELYTIAADDEFPGAAATAKAVLAKRASIRCICQSPKNTAWSCPMHGEFGRVAA